MADGASIDPVFGELARVWPGEYDHEECWRAEVRLTPKHPLRVTLRGGDPASPQACAVWHALYEAVRRGEREIRLRAAELLLEGDDETAWPRAAKEGLTPAAVARLITLEEAVLDVDGEATLWYENSRISRPCAAAARVGPDGVVRSAEFW